MTATRRLAAILAADVAGYSRLIGADEPALSKPLRRYGSSCSSQRSLHIAGGWFESVAFKPSDPAFS
jgi:hypothetical protein